MSGHSYALAEILFANLVEKRLPGFVKFVEEASYRDGGEAAASAHLKLSLRQLLEHLIRGR